MYQPKNFNHLLGTPGFSDQLLKNHFTLYEGYVKNVNALVENLESLAREGRTATPVYAELTRRFGWEWNGMRLHELYFGNMAKNAREIDRDSLILKKLGDRFGSYDNWQKDFKAVGTMRGIGWAILYYAPHSRARTNADLTPHQNKFGAGQAQNNAEKAKMDTEENGQLFNVWVNEHDMGHLAGCKPLLVLDVFEHAYTLDYGLKKADYIEAFMKAIDWETVATRFGF